MKNKRLVFYTILIVIKASIIFYAGYLNTLKIDFFSWGNSNVDGLYLLVIPIVILPAVLILSILEWFMIRKIKKPLYVKMSLYGALSLGIIITICSIFEIFWASFLAACIGSIILLITTIVAKPQLVQA